MILGGGHNQVGHVGSGGGNGAGLSYTVGEQKEVGSDGSQTVGHPARTPRASDLPELPHSPQQPAHSPAAHAEERGADAPPAPRSVSRKRAREDEPAAAALIAAAPNAVAAAGEAAKQPHASRLEDASSLLHFRFAQGACARCCGAPRLAASLVGSLPTTSTQRKR